MEPLKNPGRRGAREDHRDNVDRIDLKLVSDLNDRVSYIEEIGAQFEDVGADSRNSAHFANQLMTQLRASSEGDFTPREDPVTMATGR